MLWVLGGVLAGAYGVFWLVTMTGAFRDHALQQRFSRLHAQARQELPPEQLAALTRELRDIRDIQEAAVIQGIKLKAAQRIGLEAAIRSMANHLALKRMMPG